MGWAFFFNSSDFVRSRSPKDALAGNGPILVSNDGQLHHLSSCMSWQDALKQI
jgi:Immunity protein 35